MRKALAAAITLGIVLAFPAARPVEAAREKLQPYILAEEAAAPLAEKAAAVRQALAAGGFEIAGEYAFGEEAVIVAVTDGELRAAAAATDFGGFGAAQRVAVTRVGEKVQVAYTNPRWMGAIYRMGTDLAGVADRLSKALGAAGEFGSKNGVSEKNLGSYHYMVFMPYFDDRVELADHGGHAAAIEKVEQGLAAAAGARKVYRVDVPGKEQSLFGVAVLEGDGADATVMAACDTKTPRHTAHLPYEILVAGGKVLMLHGKFRIAQSFPDLTMGTFMKISGAPDGIEKVLRAAVR